MLSNLLGVSGLAVFKVVGQVLFLIAPITLYVMARRFVGHARGFLAGLAFVALPTFAIDTPFIVRQEIAFVFVALAFMAAFYRGGDWLGRRRGLIFVIMSLGVTLSHYSTAYLFIGGLIGTYLVITVMNLFPRSRRAVASTPLPRVWIVAVVYLAAFGWLAAATGVSADLQSKVGAALGRGIDAVTTESNPAVALQKLGSAGKVDPVASYIANTKADSSLSDAEIRESLVPVSSAEPPTAFSARVNDATGIDPSDVVRPIYYQLGLAFYAGATGLGLVLLLFARIRRLFGDVPIVLIVWGGISVVLLVAQVALPGLGSEYGLPRALMQSFFVLAVPLVVGLAACVRALPKFMRMPALALAVVLLLALYSNLIPAATGGLNRQLALGNSGPYYGTVYPHEADLAAYDWAEANLPPGAKLNLADFAAYYAAHPRTTFDVTQAGIFPWQVSSGNYVLLSKSQTEDGLVYAFGSLQGYEFPVDAYADAKLLYDEDGVRIYQKP